MMRTDQLSQHLVDELAPLLGAGETASVARLVLEDLFGWRHGQRPRLLSQDEEILAWATLNRLKAGEPTQYVTGVADFYGLRLRVSPAVLIPRPETEELVEWILEEHPADTPLRVLDLGTGSGCIALALKARRPGWHVTGYDVSPDALEVATSNAHALGLEVTFNRFNVLEDQASGHWDLIVSNPPYIPPSERAVMDAATLAHEPALALFVPEGDPLLFYRRIFALARQTAPTQVYVETNEFSNDQVLALLASAGAQNARRRQDMRGKWRMVAGGVNA
ncbi:peptide chain release factor N(5)-glutamine methyltransferase [Neolewinella lacunae]|uniref:peptide chain release factor N(5)-glutamine methyltransferase n=1 Tax=Neolewinella lacunae TaxID=1517758 RepID=A0A923T8S9_9BACT|nr:peptide chain release factor N(5)-glutamine methyltransferase [Neolewinella lacunae]MBC6994884.1 peptide chain release factor N(5)-glutamine methyltransferase [Neolewinella lacunae]MDN3636804.1 peptide chain release factor N(5)-glutamine methyltransferase [Neolewinella lacunae]